VCLLSDADRLSMPLSIRKIGMSEALWRQVKVEKKLDYWGEDGV
jgi:hypothetical protein